MKYFILFSFAFFFFNISPAQATSSLLISEVLIGNEKASDNHEFVELYNTSSSAVDISHYRLRYKNSKGTENSLAVIKDGSCIPAHGNFLWANSKGNFASLADVTTGTTLTENYSIALYPPEGDVPLDNIRWGTDYSSPVQKSLARDLVNLNWLPELANPTPEKSTGCPDAEPDPIPIPTPTSVRLNEILPNPKGDENEGEFIELYNNDEEKTDISGFSLRDASKTGEYTFPKDTILQGKEYFILKRSVSKLSLNNSNETLSLFDAGNVLVDTVQYRNTKEGVSLNYTSSGWRGSHFLTPGAPNILNALPETKEKVPKKGYKDVAVSFHAKGKDADGDTLKYTWDFGDGHKSYKRETTHKYKENGNYTVTLTTTDGSEEILETFSLEIEPFPKKKIRIVSLVPNPSGKDSDTEWIEIENREKKSINLRGFSIATGWKKLINHPIREDFILEPKQTAKLTRTFSLFSLPNQKGKIELRAPDGDVLQRIKYKLDKSIKEDVIYKKEKGKRWEWQENEEDMASASALPDNQEEKTEPEISDTETTNEVEETVSVLGASSIDHATPSAYYQLLNYGTSFHLPEKMSLSFSDEIPLDAPLTPEPIISSSFFEKINTSLNDWQNEE